MKFLGRVLLIVWEIVVYLGSFVAALFILVIGISLAIPALGDHVLPWVQNEVFPAIGRLLER